MSTIIISTDGYALEAIVDVDGARFVMMDHLTNNNGPAPIGLVASPIFRALRLCEDVQEAPDALHALTSRGGWAYRAVGVFVHPSTLEVGSMKIDIGQCARGYDGKTIELSIDRLEITTDS